jgi:hypothetical protein
VLFKYSKDPGNDFAFFKEKIPPIMYRALENILGCTNLEDEDSPFDLLIYISGLMKNCSISLKLLDLFIVDKSIMILAKMLPMAYQTDVPENYVNNKRAQLLIQITGTLRNLADSQESLAEFASLFVLERVVATMGLFKGHKELALNCSRFISKLSPHEEVCAKLTDADTLTLLVELM